jgi:hypothetical protein
MRHDSLGGACLNGEPKVRIKIARQHFGGNRYFLAIDVETLWFSIFLDMDDFEEISIEEHHITAEQYGSVVVTLSDETWQSEWRLLEGSTVLRSRVPIKTARQHFGDDRYSLALGIETLWLYSIP